MFKKRLINKIKTRYSPGQFTLNLRAAIQNTQKTELGLYCETKSNSKIQVKACNINYFSTILAMTQRLTYVIRNYRNIVV